MTDILLIATAKYLQFVPQMLESIKKHWKIPHRTILFTDRPGFERGADVEFKIKHEPFPYITLFRYHYFAQVEKEITGDYVFYVDIDARFVDDIGEEILSDLVAVRHCGFVFAKLFPQEENPKSPLYVYRFNKYFGGGFQGGKKEEYFKAVHWCRDKIDKALDMGLEPETSARRYRIGNNVALRHHDETAWNSYLTVNPPTLELSPDYHFPENSEYFRINCWQGNMPFKPKLLLLEKNHEEIRK